MRIHLRTVQIFLVVATGPMWALSAGAKAGCMQPIACVWSALVFMPLGLSGVAWRFAGSESEREKLAAFFAAIAIVGYPIALLAALMIVGSHQPFDF